MWGSGAVSAKIMKVVGYTAEQCKGAGMGARDAFEATFDVRSCLDAGETRSEISTLQRTWVK